MHAGKLIGSALAAVLALGTIPASAQDAGVAADASATNDFGGYEQVLTLLPSGVIVLQQEGFQVQPAGNVTIIQQSDGLVLVDAGGSPGAARGVIEAIRSFTDKPVKAVILTHWHGDHPQGLDQILAAWPNARTIATEATRAHLSDPATMNTPAVFDAARNKAMQDQIAGFGQYCRDMAAKAPTEAERAGWSRAARLFDFYGPDMDGAVTVAPKEGFAERLSLPDRDAPVEVLFLGRANTDGDAVIWLPKQKVLISGDLVVSPIPFGFGSYPAEWIDALKTLDAYDFDVLIPGHGHLQLDHDYVEQLIALLADVRAQVGPLAAQGLTLEDTRKRVNFSAQSKAFTHGDPWLERWFDQYWVQPIVTSAWKEARSLPIVQSLKGE